MGSWSFIATPAPHPRPLSPQGSGGHVPCGGGSHETVFWDAVVGTAPLRLQVPFPQAFSKHRADLEQDKMRIDLELETVNG